MENSRTTVTLTSKAYCQGHSDIFSSFCLNWATNKLVCLTCRLLVSPQESDWKLKNKNNE